MAGQSRNSLSPRPKQFPSLSMTRGFSAALLQGVFQQNRPEAVVDRTASDKCHRACVAEMSTTPFGK
jgi:hypothetical protein